jgi:PAS domain S-box-containing protein
MRDNARKCTQRSEVAMTSWRHATNTNPVARPLVALATGLAVVGVALAVTRPALTPLVLLPAAATWLTVRRLRGGEGLQTDQLGRLHDAELALASAAGAHEAARDLAENALALLGTRSAVVLIEGIGDTVRVTAGEGSVYGDGSRTRLLDDNGTPVGSITVSARADGRKFSDGDERILDALAQRVSSTLHRLSLFNEVQQERRTIVDVLESSSDGIFSVGTGGDVRSWNPAMARITGISERDAVGKPVHQVFRPEDEDGQPKYGGRDPGRSNAPEAALVRICGDGSEERWLTCSWSPLSAGGHVVVARDDTERKKIQDDKDGWIAQVSHELRTPLTPIKGFLHTLQRRDTEFTPEDRSRIYEVMLREEQRLEDLVTSLLQTTSLDRAGTVIVPEVVDWTSVVTHQVDLFLRQDPTRSVDLIIGPDSGEVIADEHLAVGIVSNLLSNALKYSPEGSAIEVTTRRDDDSVVTTVSDEGPGIPPGDRERIFDKFTRLGDHLTRPQQGVGLGLYIARRSVERLGGTISVDNRPSGPGATFSFTLPAHGRVDGPVDVRETAPRRRRPLRA